MTMDLFPGSDDARAAGCECNPADNGVIHPTAGDVIEPHHGQAEKPAADWADDAGVWHSGWVINGECALHNSDEFRTQEGLAR